MFAFARHVYSVNFKFENTPPLKNDTLEGHKVFVKLKSHRPSLKTPGQSERFEWEQRTTGCLKIRYRMNSGSRLVKHVARANIDQNGINSLQNVQKLLTL